LSRPSWRSRFAEKKEFLEKQMPATLDQDTPEERAIAQLEGRAGRTASGEKSSRRPCLLTVTDAHRGVWMSDDVSGRH
jgi:hypothetical protein